MTDERLISFDPQWLRGEILTKLNAPLAITADKVHHVQNGLIDIKLGDDFWIFSGENQHVLRQTTPLLGPINDALRERGIRLSLLMNGIR